MPRLVESGTGITVGNVTAADVEYLRGHIEIPTGDAETFYLDSATLSALPGAPPKLLDVLRSAMANRDGIDLSIVGAPLSDTHPAAVTNDAFDADVGVQLESELVVDDEERAEKTDMASEDDNFPSDSTFVNVRGKRLQCVVCKNQHFRFRKAQLHSAVATFFDVEWMGPSANCYVCTNCRYIHWFLPGTE